MRAVFTEPATWRYYGRMATWRSPGGSRMFIIHKNESVSAKEIEDLLSSHSKVPLLVCRTPSVGSASVL